MNKDTIPPETNAKLSTVGRKYFKFIEFDDKEELLREIRKHPIGLFFIYLSGAFVAIMMSILFGVFAFSSAADSLLEGTGVDGAAVSGITAFIGLLVVIFVLAIMIIQAILYINNVIYVTSDKVAQVLYITIFHRKISQLSIGDVQDVTVTQRGILAHLFNYGTLVVETAGEQQNYTFTFVPDPYVASKTIVTAHEHNLTKHGN